MSATRTCDRCGSPLVFRRNAADGRWMALDPYAVEGGTVVIYRNGEAADVPPGRGRLHRRHRCQGAAKAVRERADLQ